MNEFRFMDPAGRMGTVSAENFSAAYMAGGIPVEATPEIDLLSPSGELSTLHYSKASELLKSGQGWKVATQPKPLRFSDPSGRTGTVKLGYESQALAAGGTLLLKELSTDKPLTVDLPRDPKIAMSEDASFKNWFGPLPKDPASLKGWDDYQSLLEKNRKGKAGFWEGITPNMTNVPFLGTALAAVDAGKVALTAQRLKEGKPASDQDVLDLNLFLAKQEREANATMLGKAGNVIIDMTTFMAEIAGSIKAFLAPLKGVLAGKAAAKAGTEAAKKLTVGMARRALREIGDDWAKNLVAKKAAAEAGEGVAEYLAKHGSRRVAANLLGRLPEIGVATVAPTIGQIVPQLAATSMAGQDAGTMRGNQDKIYAALMGEDMSNAAAIWRSVADTTIENWSEAMGETILAGMSKIPVVGGIGQAIRKNAHLFVEKLGKAGTKEGFQAVDRIAGMTALSKWVYGKAKKGASFRMMMEDLHAVGYDGVFGEMMEERAGDFMRGLFGLEGEKDDNAVARAFKNSLPDPEQLGVELIAFSMPALAAGGLRFAALGTNADEYFRRREALDGLATLHKNRKPWEDGQFTSGDAEALQPIVRDIVREHEAYKKDSTGWAKYINSMLDGMLSMKIVDGALVVNPDVKYKNVMSVMIGTEGGRARAAYLENLGRDPTKEDLDKALDVGAEHAMRRMARQGGFIWLYDSTLRTTDGGPSAEAGSTTEKEALKYLSKTQLQALRDANLLTIDEFGKIFMLDPRSYDEDQHELMSLAFELGTARQTLEDKKATAEAREAAKKSETQALEKIGKLAPVKGASAEAVARLITLTPEEARDVALQQNIRFEGVLDLDLTEAEEKAAEARARIAAYENLELEADPPKGSLNEFLHRAVVSPESMTPEEKVRAASFLTNDPTAASLDAAASVGRRVHKLVQAGEIAFRGDKIVRTGDGQRFVVLSPFRAEKTKASMYRVAPLSETGVPLESQATAISAEDLKTKYRNETKTGTAISRISRFQGSLKPMVAHLHRSGYLGDWVRANRREGESIEKTLDRMTGQDLRGFGLVRSMKTAAGKELFYYNSGAFSLFHGPANKLSRGVAFNPMSMADMEGAHFSEDFTEMPLLQLSADENGQGRSAERLRAALPVLSSAISRAQKEAGHVLVQATKNGKTAAERADAAAKLAILRKLPSVDSDNVLHVVEAMSKTVRHYIHGYKDFPLLRLLALGDAVETLFENSSLSHDLPAIRAELETVASKEYWDALRYDRAIDAPEAPAADESTGKPPPPPPSDGGQEGNKPPPPPPAGGEGPSVPASDLLGEGHSGGPAPAPEAAQPAAEKKEAEANLRPLGEAPAPEPDLQPLDLSVQPAPEAAQPAAQEAVAQEEKAEAPVSAPPAETPPPQAAGIKGFDSDTSAVAKLAPFADSGRKGQPLSGVLLDAENQRAVATDGKVLVSVPYPVAGATRIVAPRSSGKKTIPGDYVAPRSIDANLTGGAMLEHVSETSIDALLDSTRTEHNNTVWIGDHAVLVDRVDSVLGLARKSGATHADVRVASVNGVAVLQILSDNGVESAVAVSTGLPEDKKEGGVKWAVSGAAAAASTPPAETPVAPAPKAEPSPRISVDAATAQEVYDALMDPQSAAIPGPDPEPAAAPESVKLSGDADQDARALDPDLVKNPDAFADRLVRYRPGIVRRVGALKTIARDLMGSGLLPVQSANDMLLGYMASALRLSKQEAFDVLLALRWNPGAKALAESDPTEAEMEAELSGSLAEALGLSSDAEVPMSSDRLAGSGNADMMDAKLKEVTDVVRVVLDAVMGYSPVAEIGRAIRKSAYKRPDGNLVPLGTRGLPDWMLSKEAFNAWAAERKSNMARYSANFAEKRLSQPLDAAEIMFNSVIASLPWEHALQIYKAAQNTFPREVLEIRQNDSFGTYYEALLPPDENGTQHPAVTGATLEEVAQNVAAQVKLGIYKGEISAEELAELIHEAGNGSAMVALNDAAPRMAGEQARRLRRRLRPEEYFSDANAELRAAVERVAAIMDSKRGEIGRFGAYLQSGASRFGFLMNEATDPKSPEWKKKLLEDAVEAVSLLLTGSKSSAFVEQLKKDLARDKGVTVAKSMQNLWEQLLEPLAKIERERLSGAGAESQRQVLAARDLNALIEGTAENPGVFYKALGLAYGGSELEAFAYMRDRKQFFQTNDKYLSKLLGQLAVRGVVTPVGRASGGKSFSGYRARSPMAEALERMAGRRGDLRPGVLVSEAAGMDSVEGVEMSSAQVYDKLRGIARGAFLRLQKGEVGEVFLPMMLSGDKLELNGAVWSINGETKISGDKTFADYAGPTLKGAALDKAFNEFFNDIYFGSAEKAGVHERFTRSLIEEVAPGALAPGGQFSLYRKKSDGKLERKSQAEIGKIIQDVMKRFSQIGTPIVDGAFGPPGYLQTAEDGMVEYVMLLKEDGTPYKGPGDGLLWIMPWLRDAARRTYGGTEKQASYKLGNWGQTDKGVLSQTKGAVVLDPNKYSKLDQSEPGAITPAELEEVLSDHDSRDREKDGPSLRDQLPDAMFLSTGNAQKMGPGRFDRVVTVVRGAKTYRFGVFRAAPLGITSSMPTDTSLQERWVGMQPVAGGAGILNVPGGTLDARADYYRVFMDELYSGAEARIRKAMETSDDKLFDGDNRRPMLDALAKAKGWLGGSLAAAQALFARMRGIVNAAKKKNHVKLVSPIQSTGAARADGTLAPATDGPLEYDETAKLHPSGGQIVRGTAKPSSLSDHHRLANGGLTMPGMGLGLGDISEADLKRAAKHYEKLFGRRNIPANEKELGAAAHELMTELVGMNPGATDFAKTRAILKALLAPVRTRSEFIPLDGSTVFGRSLDDAKKVVAHLQAKHHLLYDLARVKLDGGKGQFDVEYEHSRLSGYAGEGVNLDDFVVHSSEDGQTVIGFRIPGIPLLVHRSPALGHLQSMRVIRLTELTKDAAAIFYHQETLSKEGADEDGDQSHVFPLPPMSLLALHKSFEFLRDDEFEVAANARPDRFSDSYPKPLRDSWIASLVPENLERVTDPRIMAMSRDANLAGASAIGTAASMLTAIELAFRHVVLPKGVAELRDTAAEDPYIAVRFAVLHDMVNRIVDGGKVPHMMKGMMLYEQFVPVFVSAVVGNEVPFVEGLEGQALYDHVHKHTVQEVTHWLSRTPKGRRLADNVLVGGMTLGKAFRAVYGKKAKSYQPKIAALLQLGDDMTTLSSAVRAVHKFKPTSLGDMVSLLEKIDSVLGGQLESLPKLSDIPANSPLRFALESLIVPFRAALAQQIDRIEQDVLTHPTGTLSQEKAELLLANSRSKNLVWKRRSMDGESYDYGWTAAGLSRLWDLQLELHQRMALATMRARELATHPEFANMSPEDLAEEGLRGTVDPSKENSAAEYHVFDSVMRKRAELRATPEFADNVVLSALELSVAMPEAVGEKQLREAENEAKKGRVPRIRVGVSDSFSVAEARRDWAKLPLSLQIDVFDLIVRYNGPHRSESRLYDLIPPEFMKSVFELERQIAAGIHDGSINVDAVRPTNGGITLRGMMDFARESFLTQAAGATEENPGGRKIRHDGAGSYLRFAPFVQGWGPYFGAPAVPELLGENAGSVGLPAVPAPAPAAPAAPEAAQKSPKDVAVEAKAPDKYRTKELAKAAASNKVAALVDAAIADASYAKRLGLAAQAAGLLVSDAAQVKEGDVVYASVPGGGRGATPERIREFGELLASFVEAGAAVVTDNEANARGVLGFKRRVHNAKGEGVVRDILIARGFQESENKNYSLWRKGARMEAPASAEEGAKESAPEAPEVLKYPVSDLLESGRLPLAEAFILDHNIMPAGDVLADNEIEATRMLYKLVKGFRVPVGDAVDKARALGEIEALGKETLSKQVGGQSIAAIQNVLDAKNTMSILWAKQADLRKHFGNSDERDRQADRYRWDMIYDRLIDRDDAARRAAIAELNALAKRKTTRGYTKQKLQALVDALVEADAVPEEPAQAAEERGQSVAVVGVDADGTVRLRFTGNLTPKATKYYADGRWDLEKALRESDYTKEAIKAIKKHEVPGDLEASVRAAEEAVLQKLTIERVDGEAPDNFRLYAPEEANAEGDWTVVDRANGIVTRFESAAEAYAFLNSRPVANTYENLSVNKGQGEYQEWLIKLPFSAPGQHGALNSANQVGWFRVREYKSATSEEHGFIEIQEIQTAMDALFEFADWSDKSKTLANIDAALVKLRERLAQERVAGKDTGATVNRIRKVEEARAQAADFDAPWAWRGPNNETFLMNALGKDKTHEEVFVNAITQWAKNQGFTRVRFPTGETAARVEGHDTLAVRLEDLQRQKAQIIEVLSDIPGAYRMQLGREPKPGDAEQILAESKKDLDRIDAEIHQLKTQGIEKLAPIEAFYENRVGKLVDKMGAEPVTDANGNTWRELAFAAATGQSAAAPSLDNPPEVQTEAWRMAVAYPKNGRTKESFFLRQDDPDSDLGDPESLANRNRRTILREELSEAPLPADVEAALDDAMGLMNVLLYRRPLPDGSGAPAAVFDGGVVFAEHPNAVGPAIAALALKTVGENLPALNSALDPATAQALTPTERSKHAGQRASTLVEAEIVRRLAGSPSLFSSPHVWPAALAADMADMLVHHPSELLKRSRVVLVDGVPSLVSAEESRQLAPADRSLSPNDSASWERMIESDRVPEKLRAKLGRLTDAHEAIEAVVEAVDAGRIKDPDYDKVESALVRSAAENLRVRPVSGEPGEMARRELASGMSMSSIYYHDPGTRIAALRGMGIPGQHLAFYEMMNQHTASWNNGAHWLNTKAKVLPYETATLYRLFTDEEGYRREDAKVHTHLTLSQRQAEKRFEAAVTAIMEHAHKFDLSNPAMREALLDLPGTVVYGKNQAAYRRGSDERSGTLPERETIREALSHFDAELRGLLLDPEKGGRTEAEIDPFLLAEEAKAQYEKDFKELNEAAFEFLDGREYLKFREGYAGMHLYSYGRGAGMDPAGDQALADIFDHVKHADISLSFMKRPDGREDPSLKLSHKNGIPAWTDLQQKILGEQSPERLRRALKRGRAPNVVEANRLIVDAIQENLYAVAAEYHAKHGAQAGSWKPSEAEKKQIATVKQLRDVLSRFRFVESAPAEFSRELETFAEAYEKKGLVPKSMSFLTLRGEYIDRVHTAASHKAILNSYLLITNPDGSPTIMAKPAADASLERGAITRDTWIKYGDNLARHFKDKFNRHAADVPVIDPVTKKVLFTTPGIIAEIRRLYDAHADKDGQFTSPRMSSVEAWSATDKDAGRLVKMLVQVSPTEVYPWASAIQRMLAWTKTMSFGWSFFFQTALGESSIGMSGPFKDNLALTFLTRPFLKSSRENWAKFWGNVRAFREHRRYYNPAVADRLDFMLRMGLTTGRTAALEPYADVFRKDVHKIGAGLREKHGDRVARLWETFWFGADKTDQSWARFWPGVTGRKMSDWMFDWFSAVKEAQMDLAVKKLALDHGLNPDGRASWSQARFLAKYFDDGMGGQNWYRYLWATPKWMFGLNLGLLAPNWTLSSWNTSGLAPITQALFKNYPAPGQQRFIWTHYMPSMLLWVMTIIPSMLQAAAYLAGLAGGGDDDDVPLPIMNEPGRKQHIDVTPLMRLLPWYKGDPTGKRRMYLQFGKQVHETGLSNPFGARGWINEPWDQLMRKMPMPVRALYEQITGASPGSDWQLEFNGKGILGIFNSGEPGLKGFMTSRLGYIAQKLIPMSASQFIQNPEVFPLNHFAPTSKGASQSKIVKNVASVLATYASAKDWHRIRKVPRARAALDSLVPEFLRAAEANGYNPEKVLATAKGMVLGDLYARMWQALDTNDEALMKTTAASIWRVGGTLKGLKSSMANKQKSFGKELTPEQEQQAIDAVQWAMYGNE